MPTQKKIDTVKSLTDKLSRAKSLILADYQGFTHKELENLRKKLKKLGAEFVVTKNTLLKRILGESKKTVDQTSLDGATATLFSYADEISPITELVNFFKTSAKGKIKSGFLGEAPLTAKDAEKLANLPSRNTLLAQLVGQLQAPLYGFHNALSWNLRQLVWTLNAVKNKKGS